MDPSSQAAQNTQDQTQQANSDKSQGVTPIPNEDVSAVSTQVQITQQAPTPQQQKKQPISVSGGGGLEAGSAVIVQENPDDEDEEENLQVAPQEKKNLGIMGQGQEDEQGDEQQQTVSSPGVIDIQEQAPELQPAVPEVVAGSPEVEKVIEVTSEDKPRLTEEIKKIGVTYSGPGIIDVTQANLAPPKLPVTYEEAIAEEAKIKSNKFQSSKFWLLEKIKYIWRKVNPDIDKTGNKQIVKKVAPVATLPVKTDTVTTANKITMTKE